MARPLVLSNGSLLVGIDSRGLVRDCYFDYVGLENHMTEEATHLLGIWVGNPEGAGGGSFSWLGDAGWQIDIRYKDTTLAGSIKATNDTLGIKLDFIDVVYNEKNIFLRKITVNNNSNSKRTVKLFANHQFRMYGALKGDTVYYDPADNTIVHYKGRRLVVIGGLAGGVSFREYSTGLSNIEGKQGTWRDAEDGVLSGNPIEHGTVDSTIGFELTLDAGAHEPVYVWTAFAKELADAKHLHSYIIERTPEHLLESTQDYWSAWVTKRNFSFYGLSEPVVDLFKKSLLIIRTHVDNTGPIIASADSDILFYGRDTYSYVWHRDAAYIAMALDKAGYHEATRPFYEFCREVVSEEGFFYHRYRPDRSLASSWHPWVDDKGKHILPIQEDETALVLHALWNHYELTRDIEFIERLYNPLIRATAEFIAGFVNSKHLPRPSYDLWEMKLGIHAYTAATVYAGLSAAANFAQLLGKEKDKVRFSGIAENMKAAIKKHFENPKNGYFYKLIDFNGDKVLHDETIDASSLWGMVAFGIYDVRDEIITKAADALAGTLIPQGEAGGVARFEEDLYYRVDSSITGNPWLITTLWWAQYHTMKATNEDELAETKKWLDWAAARALPSGVLSEQVSPFDGAQVSVSPLIWSHSTFIATVINYLEKLQELNICDVCYPLKK